MNALQKLDQLIDDAEELLTKLGDVNTPEIARLRDRVDEAVSSTKRALQARTAEATTHVLDLAVSLDDYVHDYPWLAIAAAIALAGSVGFVTGAAVGANKRFSE